MMLMGRGEREGTQEREGRENHLHPKSPGPFVRPFCQTLPVQVFTLIASQLHPRKHVSTIAVVTCIRAAAEQFAWRLY